MNIKGTCYFSKIHNKHVIVVISDTSKDNKALIIPLSSIKFSENGNYIYNGRKCNRYDDSCTLDSDDIIANNGQNVLNRPTFALYKLADEMVINEINLSQIKSLLEYRCIVSNDVLKKLQDGAKKSDRLEERFYKYFDLF